MIYLFYCIQGLFYELYFIECAHWQYGILYYTVLDLSQVAVGTDARRDSLSEDASFS